MKRTLLVVSKQLVVLLIICLLIPPVAPARDSNANWMLLQTIPSGQPLLVKTASGRSIKGLLLHGTDSGLELNVDGKAVTFQSLDISRIYVLKGNLIKSDGLIGMAIGGAAGAIIGAVGGESSSHAHGFGPYFSKGACAGVGAAVGAIGGGLIGLAVGSFRQKKELVYKADHRR